MKDLNNDMEPIDSITLVGLCTDICVISNAMLLKAFLPEVPIMVDASLLCRSHTGEPRTGTGSHESLSDRNHLIERRCVRYGQIDMQLSVPARRESHCCDHGEGAQ